MKLKLKEIKSIFSYDHIGIVEILINIIKLLFYKLVGKRFVIKKIFGNKFILDLNTGGMSKFLFIYGKREILDTDLIREEIKGDMNILEAGANIGYYAILEASLIGNGHIYAFEPDPRNLELLRKNVEINNFSNKISIYSAAISDKNGTKKFNLYKETNLNSFVERKDKGDVINVKCLKLDDFSEIDKINFIRTDIEGAECLLINGAMNFLTNSNNIRLLIEVHPIYYDEKEFNFSKILKKLENINFSVRYLISAEKSRPEKIIDAGYQPIKTTKEGKYNRGLYENIKMDDLISFLENDKKIVRSILLEKQSN